MSTLGAIHKQWSGQPFVQALQKRFPKADIFLVGGAVRDALLGRPTTDFDLVVRNVSKPQLENFLKRYGRVSLVGKRFGVFKFLPRGWRGEEIDIALPRTEHTLRGTGAYKDFKIFSRATLPMEADLGRRDFTINAMALRLNRKSKIENHRWQDAVIDPFGGQADLKRKIIRTVGAPRLRFQEDYSRMLRALRFACQLDFTIEPQTWKAISASGRRLNQITDEQRVVPFEVIAQELHKALLADPVQAMDILDRAGVIKVLMPELLKMKDCPQPKKFHAEGDVWKHTRLALAKLSSPQFRKRFGAPPPELYWALLFHDLGKPYTIKRSDRLRFNGHDAVSAKLFGQIAQRLRLSSAGVDVVTVETIIAKHMLLASAQVERMKATTIEKYFFSERFPGKQLQQLLYADIAATVPPSGKPDFDDYQKLQRRLRHWQRPAGKPQLPKPLVNGHDIMRAFGLKPGPRIGQLLESAREEQLSGRITHKTQALAYIKTRL